MQVAIPKGLRESKGEILSDSNGSIQLIQAANEALSEDFTSRESDES
jgi:hypothetical protein